MGRIHISCHLGIYHLELQRYKREDKEAKDSIFETIYLSLYKNEKGAWNLEMASRFLFTNGVVSGTSDTPPASSLLEAHPGRPQTAKFYP